MHPTQKELTPQPLPEAAADWLAALLLSQALPQYNSLADLKEAAVSTQPKTPLESGVPVWPISVKLASAGALATLLHPLDIRTAEIGHRALANGLTTNSTDETYLLKHPQTRVPQPVINAIWETSNLTTPNDTRAAEGVAHFSLSPMEFVATCLVAQGASNAQIGNRINTPHEITRTHVEAAQEKTGSPNRTSLAVVALDNRFPFPHPTPKIPLTNFDPEQLNILAMIAGGLTNLQIARVQRQTPAVTARTIRLDIFKPLGAKNRTEAALMYVEHHEQKKQTPPPQADRDSV